MNLLRADSIDDAVRYARQCLAEGEFDLRKADPKRRLIRRPVSQP